MLVDTRRPVQPVQRGDKELVTTKQRSGGSPKVAPGSSCLGSRFRPATTSSRRVVPSKCTGAGTSASTAAAISAKLSLSPSAAAPASLGFPTEQLKVPRPVVCLDKLTGHDCSIYLTLAPGSHRPPPGVNVSAASAASQFDSGTSPRHWPAVDVRRGCADPDQS